MLVNVVHHLKLLQQSACEARREVEMMHTNMAGHNEANIERPVKEGCR